MFWTGVFIVIGLPLAGQWSRRDVPPCCVRDGATIDHSCMVEIDDAAGQRRLFCSIHCAEAWLAQQRIKPRSIRVTDEITGARLDVAAAIFVRSSVQSSPGSANRTHAFSNHAEAERHAKAFGGIVLIEDERPFRP